MFKVDTKTSSKITQEVFLVKKQGNFNLQNQTDFLFPQAKSVNYDFESIQVKIWETFQMIWKIKDLLIVLKQPLRDRDLNQVLAVFVKLIYRTQATW